MKHLYKISVPILFVFFAKLNSYCQVINIERFRVSKDTTGLFGELGLGGTLIKSSSDITILESNLLLEWKNKKDLFLLIANYNILTGDGIDLIDEALLHIRYNYILSQRWIWEVFLQLQKNELLNIQSRKLIGTGPRVILLNKKPIKIYIGSLMMVEFEDEIATPNISHLDIRNSSYLTLKLHLLETVELSSTSYFQPLFYVKKDYRVLNQSSLKLAAGKHFLFTINYNLLYDSKPALGIFPESLKLTTGITYKF